MRTWPFSRGSKASLAPVRVLWRRRVTRLVSLKPPEGLGRGRWSGAWVAGGGTDLCWGMCLGACQRTFVWHNFLMLQPAVSNQEIAQVLVFLEHQIASCY